MQLAPFGHGGCSCETSDIWSRAPRGTSPDPPAVARIAHIHAARM
jgi:hypothetical protein